MKKIAMLMVGSAMFAGSAMATVYTDALNDVNMPGGYFANQDIKSVTVTNDATTLFVSIQANSSIVATNWGKYCLMFDTTAGGDTTGNGWGRSVGMTSGMDYWVGAWADQSPVSFRQLWGYGGSWNMMNQNPVSVVGDTISMSFALSDLGLSMGSVFCFDAMTTGGGGPDSAWDLLSKSSVNDAAPFDGTTGWTEYTTSTNCLSYQVVPEPASVIALATGVAALIRRKKK